MNKSVWWLLAPLVVALPGPVAAVDKNYDMSIFLNQRHPFLSPAQAPAPVRTQQAAPAQETRPAGRPQRQPAAAADDASEMPSPATPGSPWGGFVSELRIGALAHDVGPFSSKKESGVDTNLEVLFASPEFMELIWSPRPQLGLTYNSSGDTSQAYMGLEWEYGFLDGWFASFSFGGAVHDGHLVGDKGGKTDKKSLGCRFLFREALNLGYRFRGRHAVMLHFDHISNASLCDKEVDNEATGGRHVVTLNEGLETLGLRYGYLF